jgi:Protein of unknown function (DUF1488)
MFLNRLSDRSFIVAQEGVRFGMRDIKGRRTVLCVLSRDALTSVFGVTDKGKWEGVFEANREIVEAAASEKYDAAAGHSVVCVTTGDFELGKLVLSTVGALNAYSGVSTSDFESRARDSDSGVRNDS